MNRIANILAGLSLAVLFCVASVHAESNGQGVTANIPFDFSVGSISFPAGQYEFVHTGGYIYQVRGANGRTRMTAASAPIQESTLSRKSRLTFANVDGRHILIQIWNGFADSGNDFPYRHISAQSAQHPADNGNTRGSE